MLAWIGAISALAGVLMAGVINYYTSKSAFTRQLQWERDKMLQQKLEEVGQLADEIERHFSKLSVKLILAINQGGAIHFEEKVVPLAKLEILLSFYAPELLRNVEFIELAREKFSQSLFKTVQGVSSENRQRQQLSGEVMDADKAMSDACRNLSKSAAALGRKHLRIS